jgi:putative hydrolase of the HAD superfamily
VEAVLSLLSDRGWRHLIVSNHVPELASLVEGLGLARWFDAVVTSAQVGFEKPHPRLFDAARAVTSDGAIWMIGDNPVADFAGARSAGIKAILVRTHHEVSPRADDLWGVPAILDSDAHCISRLSERCVP